MRFEICQQGETLHKVNFLTWVQCYLWCDVTNLTLCGETIWEKCEVLECKILRLEISERAELGNYIFWIFGRLGEIVSGKQCLEISEKLKIWKLKIIRNSTFSLESFAAYDWRHLIFDKFVCKVIHNSWEEGSGDNTFGHLGSKFRLKFEAFFKMLGLALVGRLVWYSTILG